MEYKVKSGERFATVALDGTECEVTFSTIYRGFEVKNNSGSDVIISLKKGVSEGDGTVKIPAGECVNYMHYRPLDTLYITGSGEVIIAAKNDGNQVFKRVLRGGESGGGDDDDKFKFIGENCGLFDYSSVDIDSKTWVNLLDKTRNITLSENVTVENEAVHFTVDDKGIYETNFPFTIYAIFKTDTQTSDYAPIVGIWNNGASGGKDFNLAVNNDKITIATRGNNYTSNISASDNFHIACISIGTAPSVGGLYIDGRLMGRTSALSDVSENYVGKYFINFLSSSENGGFASDYVHTSCGIKCVAFDTWVEDEITILKNIEYLRKKYGIEYSGNYDFYVDYSGVIFEYRDRTVARETDLPAYCAYWYTKSSNWFVPLVISEYEEGVTYTMYNKTFTSQGSFEADGKTWYYNSQQDGSYAGVADSSGYNRYCLGVLSEPLNVEVVKNFYEVLKSLNIIREG